MALPDHGQLTPLQVYHTTHLCTLWKSILFHDSFLILDTPSTYTQPLQSLLYDMYIHKTIYNVMVNHMLSQLLYMQ